MAGSQGTSQAAAHLSPELSTLNSSERRRRGGSAAASSAARLPSAAAACSGHRPVNSRHQLGHRASLLAGHACALAGYIHSACRHGRWGQRASRHGRRRPPAGQVLTARVAHPWPASSTHARGRTFSFFLSHRGIYRDERLEHRGPKARGGARPRLRQADGWADGGPQLGGVEQHACGTSRDGSERHQ